MADARLGSRGSHDHHRHGDEAAVTGIYGKAESLHAISAEKRLRPFLTEEHEGRYGSAIYLQACLPDVPSSLASIGKLHSLLTNRPDFQFVENIAGDYSEERTGVNQKSERTLALGGRVG